MRCKSLAPCRPRGPLHRATVSRASARQQESWDVVHVGDIGMSRATDAGIVE